MPSATKLELSLAPRFKTAIEAGKAWCESSMKEAVVLPALQAAVDAIVSQLGVRLIVEAPNDTDEAFRHGASPVSESCVALDDFSPA
jgi:hypothetical protein